MLAVTPQLCHHGQRSLPRQVETIFFVPQQLEKYKQGNLSLAECLRAAYVSDRNKIEESLLALPWS